MMIKTRFKILFALWILTLSAVSVQAQQSDYEIQRNFQQELSELTAEIERAETLDELTELGNRVDMLERTYSEHAELINAALYPQTYQVLTGNLREQLTQALSSAEVVEELSTRIDELNVEVSQYRDEIDAMNRTTAELQSRLQQAESNEMNQAALLQEYRQSIEQRNHFVSQFLEQLMSMYQDASPSELREISAASERLEENPLNVLESILNEYIRVTEETAGLGPTDYASMRAQYHYFAEVWERIGNSLTTTFGGENAAAAKTSIDNQLSEWVSAIDSTLWNTISDAFHINGIELERFSNREEFYNALYGYVDSRRVDSQQTNSEEDYQTYVNFNDYWNTTVKSDWGELLVDADILSTEKIATIDMTLAEWGETAPPESNMMLILLIISIVIIIGLVVLMLMRRT